MIGGNYMAKTITFKDGADLDPRENDRLKEKLKAYEPIIDKLAEVRQGVFQIKQEDEGWVLLIRKAHPLSDDIG